ncbi:hypothetical protein BDZ94DRAFT_1270336 [Collybia nuda]|uniref:DUF1996 domain-containing protein n=1 Tax=Collybia nuda TaxID=64659 RepID=A0A9P5XZK8_9AGAR|nr:hypothetical protein BDZ94DRAFT_1270336 [Collybia nuda]
MFSPLLLALAYSGTVHAWFRVACTDPLVQVRVDPIISPTLTPSNHVHTVHGGSNFKGTSTYDSLRASKCTNCEVAQDLSNYWFPKLYFHDPKTKLFEPVGNGGLLIYYQNRGDGDVRNGGAGLKTFPPGFKMISGNPRARSKKYPRLEGSQGELRERAVEYACLRYPNDAGYNGNGFPNTDCEAGLNARIHMPACWDGVNVDSADHMSHVAYLSGLDNGKCPSTHPVPLMKLFYEITWDVHAFSSRWNAGTDAWPFVYATGDPTGYSWHGDFQNGWDTTALQNAINYCDNPNDQTGSGVTEACRYLTVTSASVANQCKIPPVINEAINGTLARLPGCNPLQMGPGDATFYSDSNCPI